MRSIGTRALVPALLVIAMMSVAVLAGRGPGRVVADRPGRSTPANGVGAIDRRFIVQPRTVTQEAGAGRLRLALTVSPLVPGANHLVLTVTDRGRAVQGARVRLAATMPDMEMTPLSYGAREADADTGRYVTTADLSMYGSWVLAVRVDHGGGAPAVHVFHVDLSFPPALLQAVATREAAR